MHATHTVHAVPDLRVAAGRFAGRLFFQFAREDHKSKDELLKLSYSFKQLRYLAVADCNSTHVYE